MSYCRAIHLLSLLFYNDKGVNIVLEFLSCVFADIDECRQNPTRCTNGQCMNTPGSFRCVCDLGFNIQDGTCSGERALN